MTYKKVKINLNDLRQNFNQYIKKVKRWDTDHFRVFLKNGIILDVEYFPLYMEA